MDDQCKAFLDQYRETLAPDEASKYNSFSADYFCADEYNANVCADLILKGEKQASCSMAYWYDYEGEPRPQVGHLQVVTDWDGKPVCIIEVTSVTDCKYKDVTPEFAAAEGEGDKSLKWWRKAHWDFFSKECEELGIELTENIHLVLERFQVVYK